MHLQKTFLCSLSLLRHLLKVHASAPLAPLLTGALPVTGELATNGGARQMRRATYVVLLIVVTWFCQLCSADAAGQWEARAIYSMRHTSSYFTAAIWPAVTSEVTGIYHLNPNWDVAVGASASLAGNLLGSVADFVASGDRGPDSTGFHLQVSYQPVLWPQPFQQQNPLTLNLSLGAQTTADHFVGDITEKTSTLTAGLHLAYSLPHGMVLAGGAQRSILAYGQILSAPLSVATNDITTSQTYMELLYHANNWHSTLGFSYSTQNDLYPDRTLQISSTGAIYLGCGWNY